MTPQEILPTGRFTDAQLDLLKLFSKSLPDDTWKDLKQIISNYFADKATKEMDALFAENGWDEKKIDDWNKEHMRTPYKA